MDLILHRYDTHPDKEVEFGEQKVHTLGYADDVTLLDVTAATATQRVTSIVAGSKRDTDMIISVSNTDITRPTLHPADLIFVRTINMGPHPTDVHRVDHKKIDILQTITVQTLFS